MKNIFTKIAIVILITMPSCKDMKLDIQDSKDRLDVLEGTTITTINEQITAINSSITDLQSMDETLDGYIKTLETTAADLQKQINDANAEITKVESELGEEITALEQSLLNELNSAKEAIQAELSAINKTLDDLKAADTALDKKIADLRTYVDTELASTKDWANATFSTLTQYEQTQTEISGIKASIERMNADMTALETRLNVKIATDIQSAIDALRSELSTDYIARVESAVNTMTQAYTTAISSAKDELTSAYTDAIATAISESETNMRSWVNTVLTQGYYDIATIDGKMSALSARLDETDTDLQKQITEQKTALETSKEELTKAYKNAIKEAIEENNGVINTSIAEAVQNLEDKIQARLTVIDTNISNIQKQIANISKDITSIYEQIAGITSSISGLQDVDKELQTVVGNLETELADLQEEFELLKPIDEPTRQALLKEIEDLKALIQALQAKDTDLQNQISVLQSYIDAELKETADWAEATFATLEQYSAIQAEISAIKTLIDKTKADITEEYTTAIETAISNSETSMKAWVNTLLAQGYYTISDINGKVSALEALITDGDSNLQMQINEQKTALQQAKTDLTTEYKQYINQAIASGGIIDQAIATQVKKAQDELQSKIDAINERLDALEDRLGKLEEDFVNRIQSLKYIPEYSDGTVMVSDIFRLKLTVDFLVSPAIQAEAVRDAWQANKNIVKSYLRYTKPAETKSISPAIALEVMAVYVNENGVLTVSLAESEDNPVDADDWYKEFDGVVYLQITDGNTDVVSDFIKIQTYYDDLSKIEDTANDEFDDLSPLIEGKYRTANSYIVSQAGVYTFKAYKGNSQELAGSLTSDNHPMGLIDKVDVLWETFGTKIIPKIGSLVQTVGYNGESIYFRTPFEFSEGNAVIAAKDAAGNILWSWHIWLTDQPQGQEYYNNAGIMMDRNLGATSATPGEVGALGLLYQWGRKDPFLGSSSISSSTTAKSTISWPSSVSSTSSTGTVSYITANPTTFVSGVSSSDDDWLYSSRNNTLWTTSDKTKSIYDPCPAGWRVPDGGGSGVWSKALGSSSFFTQSSLYNSTNEGMNFSSKFGSASTIWYPASGYRGGGDGGLNGVGGNGYCWSASPYSGGAYYLYFDSDGGVNLSGGNFRAFGHSVRCLQE